MKFFIRFSKLIQRNKLIFYYFYVHYVFPRRLQKIEGQVANVIKSN